MYVTFIFVLNKYTVLFPFSTSFLLTHKTFSSNIFRQKLLIKNFSEVVDRWLSHNIIDVVFRVRRNKKVSKIVYSTLLCLNTTIHFNFQTSPLSFFSRQSGLSSPSARKSIGGLVSTIIAS